MVPCIRQNFQITLPSIIRKGLKLHIDDLIETEVRGGKIILTPQKAIDADQAWFWSKHWQKAEQEAEEDLKKGRVKKFKSVEELIKDLD